MRGKCHILFLHSAYLIRLAGVAILMMCVPPIPLPCMAACDAEIGLLGLGCLQISFHYCCFGLEGNFLFQKTNRCNNYHQDWCWYKRAVATSDQLITCGKYGVLNKRKCSSSPNRRLCCSITSMTAPFICMLKSQVEEDHTK